MARHYRDGPKWMEGILECQGTLSYVVQVNHGMLWRRHIDQLRNGPSTAQQTVMWRFPLVLRQKRGWKSKCKKQRMVAVNRQTMLLHKQRLIVSQKLLIAMSEGTHHGFANPFKGTSN